MEHFVILAILFLGVGGWDTTPGPPDRPDMADPCARNDHFTDPKFTCCAQKRYDSPKIYANPSDCFRTHSDKIVKSAWAAFKCLVDKEISGKVTYENLGAILMKPLPSDVQNTIKAHLKNWTEISYSPMDGIAELEEYKDYANAWWVYYLAENMACYDVRKKTVPTKIYWGDEHKCYGYINQFSKRGDCCRGIPIPFQIYPDPIVDQYYALKNWTAINLMTIPSKDYNWKNTTVVMYSDNIRECQRTAIMIQQNLVNLTVLTKQITDWVKPNYGEIAEMIIPKFISGNARRETVAEVANETAIMEDFDIRDLSDWKTSMYQYVYANEWKRGSYKENSTRFLFWNCRAHTLLMTRYKDSSVSSFCY